jgi:hypothetical protein
MLCKYRLTDDEQIFTNEAFREIFGFFYGKAPVVVQKIMATEPTDAMVDVLVEMLVVAQRGTSGIQWLPTPQGFRPGGPAGLIAGYLLKIARWKGLQDNRIMFLVRVSIARDFRMRME